MVVPDNNKEEEEEDNNPPLYNNGCCTIIHHAVENSTGNRHYFNGGKTHSKPRTIISYLEIGFLRVQLLSSVGLFALPLTLSVNNDFITFHATKSTPLWTFCTVSQSISLADFLALQKSPLPLHGSTSTFSPSSKYCSGRSKMGIFSFLY